MADARPLFRFVQLELPWELGPPDGRYLLRSTDAPDTPPTHVVVLATLGAAERRRLSGTRRGGRAVAPEPPPTPVATSRATIVDVARPLTDPGEAQRWLAAAGDAELTDGIAVLNRTLHAFRLATADPYVTAVGRRQPIAARIGFGAGEQVADGRWAAARDVPPDAGPRRRRTRMLAPDARLAALLGAHDAALLCEELTLRARLDLDGGRARAAALQLLAALDAALAELPGDAQADVLTERVTELRGQREAVATAAREALHGALDEAAGQAVAHTLGRLEAALRARAAAGA